MEVKTWQQQWMDLLKNPRPISIQRTVYHTVYIRLTAVEGFMYYICMIYRYSNSIYIPEMPLKIVAYWKIKYIIGSAVMAQCTCMSAPGEIKVLSPRRWLIIHATNQMPDEAALYHFTQQQNMTVLPGHMDRKQ